MAEPPLPPRQFLFLQGLPGDFLARLAHQLAHEGHGVHRVNFNGGDQADWPRPGAIAYRGSQGRWSAFLMDLIRARGITDLVLFGDCRPLHRTARATAAGLDVAVHVFEEGYIRPDWVTLERGGVNGFSPLPADPVWYRQAASFLAPLPPRPLLASSVPARVRATVRYYLASTLLAWRYPFYHTHRPWPPILEAAGWAARLARRIGRSRSPFNPGCPAQPYFLLPLQLESDSQLRAHSDYDGMQPALAEVLASFASHAPGDVRLLVKAHPLDNGLVPWRRRIEALAKILGIAGRVWFVDDADIGPVVQGALGVVTVNSTTGALALSAGRPVITLGRAIYDLAGLTHQGDLSSFWTAPQAPDAALYSAFKRVLAERCLLRGGFYRDDPDQPLAVAAARRLLQPAAIPVRARRAREVHQSPALVGTP